MRAFVLLFAIAAFLAPGAQASTINFDDQGLTGPGKFSGTSAKRVRLTIDGITVTIMNGAVLAGTTFLPTNDSSVYGTAHFLKGGKNPLRLKFSQEVENLSIDVFNGNIRRTLYTVRDNEGHKTSAMLRRNSNRGFKTMGFAEAGTVVTIKAGPSRFGYDFFIDNIHFDVPQPEPTPVPLPAALPMLAGALTFLGLVRRRRQG